MLDMILGLTIGVILFVPFIFLCFWMSVGLKETIECMKYAKSVIQEDFQTLKEKTKNH